MKLRSKVVALLVCVFAVFGAAGYAIQRTVVLPSFLELEHEEAVKDVGRCSQALTREIEHLTVQCMDWAAWDDTYQFIVDGNAEYVDATLLPESFQSAKIDLVYYFDAEDGFKWGQTRDSETLELIPSESIALDRLAREQDLLGHKSLDSIKNGLIMTERGPLLVASLPILTSDREGPIRGTLMMGRFLTEQKIKLLAEQTRVDLAIWPLDSDDIPKEDRVALARVRPDGSVFTELRGNKLAALSVFPDIAGRAALLLRANMPRAIAAKGVAAMRFATASVLASGLITLLVLLVLLQRVVIGPLGQLTEHAVNIGVSGSLTSKLVMKRRDEIGMLAGEFNRMVQKLAESRKHLLEASHNAGRAEIASGVLHNVGNALNSMNVSADRALKKVQGLEVQDLAALSELLHQHADDLAAFVSDDKRGKLVPAFLSELSKHFADEQNTVLEELRLLATSVDHITEIVNTQQAYTGASGVMDTLMLAEVIEDAVRINDAAMARHGVTLLREFDDVPAVTSDRHAVLQILINLLNNAKYALDEGRPDVKRVIVRLRQERGPEDNVCVDVVDNGVGIAQENLTRIFAHGFTTRAEGHGFGLHTGALSAKNLGGSLTVQSDGVGHGATFTLRLPLAPVRA